MKHVLLQLERKGTMNLSDQIYSWMRSEITCGNFSCNEKLPSKRKLAASLQCSLNTVQAAYDQLADEGYLISREKSGYFVAEMDGVVDLGERFQDMPKHIPLQQRFDYDFSYQGVDRERFPFARWRKVMREGINGDDTDLLGVGNPKGQFGLRSSIARYLRYSRGVVCLPEQIVVSSGTESLLQLIMQLFEASTVYGIENPGYEKLSLLFRSNRARYTPLPLDEQGLLPESLEQSPVDVICITPSHQFPTGCIMPIGRRIQLLNWAYGNTGRFIIEDDYDSEFRYSGNPIPSLQGLDRQGTVVYLGSFSKSLSPALRISYMVLPEKLVGIFDEKLNFHVCPVPTFEQKALQEFMDSGQFERHLNRMRNTYGRKRETLVSAIRDMLPGSEIDGVAAGLHIVLHVYNGMDETELVSSAEKNRVKVYGMSRYYSDLSKQETTNTVLLGYSTMGIDDIGKAVSLLRDSWFPTT